MNKKPKISFTLVLSLVAFLAIAFSLSFYFYSLTKDKGEVKKVYSNNLVSIDSIKQVAVRDTVSYFNKTLGDTIKYFDNKINALQNQLSSKDTSINKKMSEMSRMIKNYDSLSVKLDYYRSRYRIRKLTDSIK